MKRGGGMRWIVVENGVEHTRKVTGIIKKPWHTEEPRLRMHPNNSKMRMTYDTISFYENRRSCF